MSYRFGPEDLKQGRDYFYVDGNTQLLRTFRVLRLNHPTSNSHATMAEVRSDGSLESSFAYNKDQLRRNFIPKMSGEVSEFLPLIKILAYCKGADLSDVLNELLVKLEV